jgi:plasmid stabilization system protein ParE
MRVVFTFQARVQLEKIHSYIARENASAADVVAARVGEVANALGDQPYMGRKVPRSRLRRFPVHPYPYLIYYEVAGDTVRIVRIRHAARYRAAFQEPVRAFAF